MNIILLGFPGAGKGTQAVMLKEKYNFKHISTGDLIRHEIANHTPLGDKIKLLTSQGNLVPDEDIIKLLMSVVEGYGGSIIFDGFPRTTAQAETLDKYLAKQGKKVDAVILLSLGEDVVLKRLTSRRVCGKCGTIYNIYSADYTGICLKCGGQLITRPDDTLESAKHRLEVFKKETRPLIEYYKKSGVLKEVDGGGTPHEVFGKVQDTLGLKK